MTNLIWIVISVLVQVESNGDPAAVGDDGRAVGILQMHAIALDEANRLEAIAARRENRQPRRWSDTDRYDPAANLDMAFVTLEHHYRRGVTDPVDLACRWNRPDGSASQRYRNRVQKYWLERTHQQERL